MTTSSPCWHCSASVSHGSLFCPSCKTIQPPVDIDHFTRLNQPRRFDIGEKNLEVAYFGLQRSLHPDVFVRKSDQEKRYSMAHSLDVNAAYETLRLPLKRAEYLLKLEGVIVNQDSSDSVKPSQALLMESLDAREALENATTGEEIRRITTQAHDDRLAAIDHIKTCLEKKNLAEAAQSTIQLRYLEKLLEEAKHHSLVKT